LFYLSSTQGFGGNLHFGFCLRVGLLAGCGSLYYNILIQLKNHNQANREIWFVKKNRLNSRRLIQKRRQKRFLAFGSAFTVWAA